MEGEIKRGQFLIAVSLAILNLSKTCLVGSLNLEELVFIFVYVVFAFFGQ